MQATTRALVKLGRQALAELDSGTLADIVVELAEELSQLEGNRSGPATSGIARGENALVKGHRLSEISLNPDKTLSTGQGKNHSNDKELPENSASNTRVFSKDDTIDESAGGEVTLSGTQSGYTVEFAGWYRHYPKKVGKRAAFKAFKAAKKRAEGGVNELVRAVAQFAASDKGKGDFVPNPATWLNEDRFLDDPKQWNQFGEKSLDEYADEFEAFYHNYPKKTQRQVALAAFAEVVSEGASVKKILAAVNVFKVSRKGQSKFCPNAASWLKQRWFDDDPVRWNDDGSNGQGQIGEEI